MGNSAANNAAPIARIAYEGFIDGTALALADLVARWERLTNHANSKIFIHLGFAGTGTQPDLSGHGNSGTVTGATVGAHVPLGPMFGLDAALPYRVAAPHSLAAALGTLTLTGLVPSFAQANILAAPVGTLTLTGLVPTVTQGNSLAAALGALTLTGLVPSFTQGNSLAAVLGTLTLDGLVPTFAQSGGVTMAAELGTLTLTGLVPTFLRGDVQTSRGGEGPHYWPPERRRERLDDIAEEVAGKRHAKASAEVQEAAAEIARELAEGRYASEQAAVAEMQRIAKLRAWRWREQYARLMLAYFEAMQESERIERERESAWRQANLLAQVGLLDLRRRRAALALLLMMAVQ
jgi:hypothetical protein